MVFLPWGGVQDPDFKSLKSLGSKSYFVKSIFGGDDGSSSRAASGVSYLSGPSSIDSTIIFGGDSASGSGRDVRLMFVMGLISFLYSR